MQIKLRFVRKLEAQAFLHWYVNMLVISREAAYLSDERKSNVNRIVIDEREEITINGVEEVISFDDESIICTSELGMIVIKGSELHIGKLSLEEGILMAQGMIESVSYQDEPLTSGGFLKKLFR